MSIIGKTLGNFECTALLGKGGMGEVYQVKDRKLGRDVAIKVLPEEFAKETDRVSRFQREAKLLASLNHPNIAAIYGLEESEGIHFLILELIIAGVAVWYLRPLESRHVHRFDYNLPEDQEFGASYYGKYLTVSPDGKELFYRGIDSETGSVLAVPVEIDPIFKLGTPQNLFTGPYRDWDIGPYGKRFLMVKETKATGDDSTQGSPRKFYIVLNWFEELKEQLPVE